MLSKSSNIFEENINIYLYFSLSMTNTQIDITFLEEKNNNTDSRNARGSHLSHLQMA